MYTVKRSHTLIILATLLLSWLPSKEANAQAYLQFSITMSMYAEELQDKGTDDEIYIDFYARNTNVSKYGRTRRIPAEDGRSYAAEEYEDTGYIPFRTGWKYEDIYIGDEIVYDGSEPYDAEYAFRIYDQDWPSEDDQIGGG